LRMRAVSYCNICVCACGSMLCPKTAATLCRADHFLDSAVHPAVQTPADKSGSTLLTARDQPFNLLHVQNVQDSLMYELHGRHCWQ
jgi:hypothetical protein